MPKFTHIFGVCQKYCVNLATNISLQNMKQPVIRAILMVCMMVSLYVGAAQTKIARQTPDGKFEIVAEMRSVRKIFVNLFSNEMGIVDPVNIGIKQSNGTVDLKGAIFLTAESHIGEEGEGSKVMRVYVTWGADGFIYLPIQIVGEECANVSCTRCAFDDDTGCFCSLRTEENSHVVGCRHLIYAGENKQK